MPTFEQTKNGYKNLWNSAVLTRQASADAAADKIITYKKRYQHIESKTGVPWYMVGVLHNRESSLNFNTHLHNGDSLNYRTHHVPAGRPLGPPPFTWEESAMDALTMKGLDKITSWPIERVLYECERYNGWGYFNNGYGNSPYIWAGTNHYSQGKYVADGRYDPTVVDKQLGCAAMLKSIFNKEQIHSTPSVPQTTTKTFIERLFEWLRSFGR